MLVDILDRPEDLDVDALMARIRDEVAQRRDAAAGDVPVSPAGADPPRDFTVGHALGAQAEFNGSLANALALAARCLGELTDRLSTAEARLAQLERAAQAPAPAQQSRDVFGASDALTWLPGGHPLARPGVDEPGHLSPNGVSHFVRPEAPTTGQVGVADEFRQLRLAFQIGLASLDAMIAERSRGHR